MRFYIGLHHPCDAQHFERCMVSVNALRNRKGYFNAWEWMMDSGAFTEISTHGRYRDSVQEYATQIRKWWRNALLIAAVSQDYMCEPFILEKTGLSVAEHQQLTIKRYDELRAAVWPYVYILPVLQGYKPQEYVEHVRMYGERLKPDQWVGVGSVCKRNAKMDEIEAVLTGIKRERPDLRLHGFGIKKTSLASSIVRGALYSADSMAWSYAARREGRNANDPMEAKAYLEAIENQVVIERAK
jgi:hypothetical protein